MANLETQHEYAPEADAAAENGVESIHALNQELSIIDKFVAEQNPDANPADVTALTDEILIDEASHRVEHGDLPERILAAAALIGEEGAEEAEGKATSGANVIRTWESQPMNGRYLDEVVAAYDELGRTDDAIRLATAIDSVGSAHDAAQVEYIPAVESAPRYTGELKRMLEHGEVAPAEAAIIDALHGGAELETGAERAAYERTGQMLRNFERDYDAEAFTAAVGVLETLAGHGANIETVEDMLSQKAYGTSGERSFINPASLKRLVDQAPSDDSLALIARLSQHRELRFDQTDRTKPEDILDTIVNMPEQYGPVVGMVDSRVAEVAAAGYDAHVLAEETKAAFGRYAANNIPAGFASAGEFVASSLATKYDLMQTFGNAGIELETVLTGEKPNGDRLLDSIAHRQRYDAAINVAAERARVEATTEKLTAFAAAQPELMDAVRPFLVTANRVEEIDPVLDTISEKTDILDVIGQRTGEGSAELARSIAVYVRNEADAGAMRYQLTELARATRNMDVDIAHSMAGVLLQGVRGADVVDAAIGVVESPAFQDALKDEYLHGEVRSAMLWLLDGKADLERDFAIAKNIGGERYLGNLVMAESKLSAQAKESFYTQAGNVLSSRDKDGFLYNSPQMLATAVLQSERRSNGDESLAWFAASGMPIAAYESVDYYREAARTAGIEDDPNRIYDWMNNDPLKSVELSHHNADEYVKTLLQEVNPNETFSDEERGQIIAAAAELADGMQDDFRTFVNIGAESLQMAAENGGKLKSTWELNGRVANASDPTGNYDTGYLFNRSGVEVALGIRSQGDREHPIYGSAGFIGDGVPSGAYGYGEVMLSFKADEADQSSVTYSPEDSFRVAQRVTERDARILKVLKTAAGRGSSRGADYIETQIVGGLDLAKVEAAYVDSVEAIDSLPLALRDKAVVRTSPSTVANPGDRSAYRATRETAMLTAVLQRIQQSRPTAPAPQPAQAVSSGAYSRFDDVPGSGFVF